jgi:hypothetical protein
MCCIQSGGIDLRYIFSLESLIKFRLSKIQVGSLQLAVPVFVNGFLF